MGITFNIDEILQMAVQIEKNGYNFYKKAAENTGDADSKKLFSDLAEMEVSHLNFFEKMKADLTAAESESTVWDPDDEGALYLQAFASGHVFKKERDSASELKGKESVEEILKIAIGLEKDTIVFYLGLKEMVPENLGKDKVNGVVKEEMSHIRILSSQLKKLGK